MGKSFTGECQVWGGSRKPIPLVSLRARGEGTWVLPHQGRVDSGYESLGASLCKEDSQDLLTSALLHCTQGLQLVALAPAKQPPPPG